MGSREVGARAPRWPLAAADCKYLPARARPLAQLAGGPHAKDDCPIDWRARARAGPLPAGGGGGARISRLGGSSGRRPKTQRSLPACLLGSPSRNERLACAAFAPRCFGAPAARASSQFANATPAAAAAS